MKEDAMKELERILSSEEELQPMTGFSTRVMRAVREEAEAKPPIAFPWTRFLPGLILNLGLLIWGAVQLILEFEGAAGALLTGDWLSDPHAQSLFWAGLMVVGSGLLAWMAARWGTSRPTAYF